MLTIAATEPHQSPVPIKSWWQRENRESKPRLMCVATERQRERKRERGQRYCRFAITLTFCFSITNTLWNYYILRKKDMLVCIHAGMYKANGDKYSASLSHTFSPQCSPQYLLNLFFLDFNKQRWKETNPWPMRKWWCGDIYLRFPSIDTMLLVQSIPI